MKVVVLHPSRYQQIQLIRDRGFIQGKQQVHLGIISIGEWMNEVSEVVYMAKSKSPGTDPWGTSVGSWCGVKS